MKIQLAIGKKENESMCKNKQINKEPPLKLAIELTVLLAIILKKNNLLQGKNLAL